MNTAANQATEIFRKTTGKGFVLVVSTVPSVTNGKSLVATVDGKAVKPAIRIYDAPKVIGTKTVMAQLDCVALTREEYDAIMLGWRGPVAPVAASDRRAVPMTLELAAEVRAFERGALRRGGLEVE